MRAVLAQLERSLHDAFDGFDTAQLTDAELRHVVERLAWIEKFSVAARLKAASALRRRGDRNTAERMARSAGVSSSQARRDLDARDRVAESTQEATLLLDRGELSLEQAAEIAATAEQAPGSEPAMIAFAHANSVAALREEGRRRRLSAIDVEELHRRQHAARRFRSWMNDLGNVCFAGELPPERGVPIMNRIHAETDRVFRKASREKRCEPTEAYAPDAFVTLVNRSAVKGKHDRADLIIVADINAYRRGHAEPGEVCHIVGAGQIPVSVAREMASDAFLKAVLHDGVQIHTIKHFGRRYKAELLTWLHVGKPPGFDGMRCEHCARRLGVQIDHLDPIANGGITESMNLEPKCRCSHRDKTEQDRAAGKLNGRAPP